MWTSIIIHVFYVLQCLCIPNKICFDIDLYFHVKQTTTFICKLNLLSNVFVPCVLFYRLCSVPYYEVVRVIQPGLQPQSGATPVLDLGCPRKLFNPDDEICIPMTRNDIIHRLLYNRYKYSIQWSQYRYFHMNTYVWTWWII